MPQMMFVNLPITDVKRTRAFHEALGYTINDQFSNDHSACVVISEHNFLMVLEREKFAGFAPRPLSDPSTSTAAIIALNLDSREAVDTMLAAALANGGTDNNKVQDMEGFMYGVSFSDPDGNVFEPFWMNPAATGGQ